MDFPGFSTTPFGTFSHMKIPGNPGIMPDISHLASHLTSDSSGSTTGDVSNSPAGVAALVSDSQKVEGKNVLRSAV